MIIRKTASRIRTPLCTGLILILGATPFQVGELDGAQPDQARQILDRCEVGGGLIVHLGCAGGRLTAALHAGDQYLVHGLDADPAKVDEARLHVRSQGLEGKVLIERFRGNRLPYVDNLVNLLVSEDPGGVAMEEILRVLCPGGVAYVKSGGRWTKRVKAWPEEIDQWTHYLHDASGNAVARDARVGPPRHVQWTAEPTWTRSHHTLASISAVVSAGGRIFYIVDEGPTASIAAPSDWFLVARDAFNGILLWKQPIDTWAWHRRRFRSGPVQLPRLLVAEGDRVYVTLGVNGPVTALDAATGQVIRTYRQTEGTEEIILDHGLLLAVTGSPAAEQAGGDPARRGENPFPNEKSILAVRADSGEVLWKRSKPAAESPLPLTLAAEGSRVFFATGPSVVGLDRETGSPLWQWSAVPNKPPATQSEKSDSGAKSGRKKKSTQESRSSGWSVATLVVHEGVVLWANGKRLSALSADSGAALWDCACKVGFKSPVDVFATAGLVWLGPNFSEGRDLKTGEVKKTNTVVEDLWTAGHHHRCYREKATQRFILTGKRGIEFVDLESDDHFRHNWVRGLCQYGIMPSNGLIYAPSHSCGCFMEAKLYGFWALAAAKAESGARKAESGKRKAEEASPLEHGPAYGALSRPIAASGSLTTEDWPTLRGNSLRSGSTTMEISLPSREAWQADVGGRLSAPVVAGQYVLVSAVDAHRVAALDRSDGKVRWTFTAGGRVDSPPTVYRGLVLFGSADGWVYALRLRDGVEAWRFRAAPDEMKTVALAQLESVWPVHGSVLVSGGVAYVAAGRSSYLDGGIVLYGLDPITGKTVCRTPVESEHAGIDTTAKNDFGPQPKKIVQNATDYKTFTAPDRSDAFYTSGTTSDVLVGDGTSVYLRTLRFDSAGVQQENRSRHLFSTSSLLDGAENHRSHFVLGTGDFTRTPVAYSWVAYSPNRFGSYLAVPYGLLLSFDDRNVWGIRRDNSGGYVLFAEDNRPFSGDEEPLPDFRPAQSKVSPTWKWSVDLAMRPWAMLRAGGSLVLGGAPLDDEQTGLLHVFSSTDGTKLAERSLDARPVWDGMAAVGGRLYLSTTDGKVRCFSGE